MPHAFILDFGGASLADYDAIRDRMELGGRMPDGGLAHVSAASPDGFRVCDVWESPGHFERFAAAKIGPLAAQHGIDQPAIRSFACHRWHRASTAAPTFAQVVILPGIDLETFDRHDASIRDGDTWPEGIVWHAAGLLDGSACVVDAWTDKAIRDAFMGSRVRPEMEKAPLTGPPVIEELAVHGALQPAGAQSPA